MEAEPNHSKSLKQKAAALNALVSGPLSSSTSRLADRSRGIPYEKDFHFYNNFDEFKSPAREVAGKSESILRSIGSSCPLWGSREPPPFPPDPDDAYDWLVNVNDEFLERFGVSMDEFKCSREKEEESGGRIDPADSEGGFQLVYGKKKRGYVRDSEKDDGFPVPSSSAGVKVASRDTKTTAPRSKVPFHIPTIPRPQKEFNILVNNSNQPFDHVWLERSEDGGRFVHPLEKLSVLNFVDRNVEDGEPIKPLPIESTPFKLVDGVKELKELAAKLRNVNEFAVDLEHNQYRSFLGLTCLMQISTRIEDFIIDTLKLRVHVGPYLREVFKDPAKRKVMHGADRDILWLQRDFGIYVCNLFDTGQASRVMQLERNSLEYLLHHFCEVNANKEYQKADWRIRPLPEEMLKYAREDTHYLLHMYDLMKNRLLSASSSENDLLLEVYKRSYEVCMQLYEKELLTNTSYLYIYGLQEADFNSKQLAIVNGLCEWRDKIAREEDESTGYILPNKALLEIARQMPLSFGKLRRLVKSKHPYVERHVNSVVAIISGSIENSSSFESISEQLKKGRHEVFPVQTIEVASNTESIPEDPIEFTVDQRNVVDGASNGSTMQSIEDVAASVVALDDDAEPSTTEVFSNQTDLVSKYQQEENLQSVPLSDGAGAFKKEKTENGITKSLGSVKKASIASVQISKKQTSAFGALLGNTSSRRKFNPDNGVTFEQDKNANLVAQIKSSVSLPFHIFSGEENPPKPRSETTVKHSLLDTPKQCPDQPPAETSKQEDVITLNDDSDGSRSPAEIPTADDDLKHREWFPRLPENGGVEAFPAEPDTAESPMSLSDLSSSFRECFQSINEMRGSKQKQAPYPEAEINFQLKPFDYAAARENMKFGEAGKEGGTEGDGDGAPPDSGERRKKGSAVGRASAEERSGGFQHPRRRQAFPLSGNRSATYR